MLDASTATIPDILASFINPLFLFVNVIKMGLQSRHNSNDGHHQILILLLDGLTFVAASSTEHTQAHLFN